MVETDKGYDTADIIAACRKLSVTLHVTSHVPRTTVSPVGTAFDGRTMWQAGDQTALEVRKRIKEVFGWLKSAGAWARGV